MGRELGLVDDERWARFNEKQARYTQGKQALEQSRFTPTQLPAEWAEAHLERAPSDPVTAWELLARPGVGYAAVAELVDSGIAPGSELAQLLETEARYTGYLRRQDAEIARLRRQETQAIPEGFDYARVRGLSTEVREKLESARPGTLGQAGRIPGVTPAAVSLLLVHLTARNRAAG